MSWLLLAALGMLWAAFLSPTKKASPNASVRTFERDMRRLGRDETVIEAPLPPEPDPARARALHRRAFMALVYAIVFTFLVGLAPALRDAWYATALLAVCLAAYVRALRLRRERAIERRRATERARIEAESRRRRQSGPLVPSFDDREFEFGDIVIRRMGGSSGR